MDTSPQRAISERQRATEWIPPAELKAGESAKDIIIRTIQPAVAKEFVKQHHYSGKTAASSSLHFGVYWKGQLEGVLQYGHPIDKRKSLTLVKDTPWSGFLELNRMAFSAALPKNTESRALAITLKMIRKHRPDIKWIVSYADATQCGSGTIYRAAGFLLTGIKPNATIIYVPSMNEAFTKLTFTSMKSHRTYERIKQATGVDCLKEMAGAASVTNIIKALGARTLKGYQIRYLYIQDPAYREKINTPILNYDEIKKLDLPEGLK